MGSVQTDHSVAFCFLKYKHIYNGGTVTLTLQKLIIIKKEKSIHKETKGSSALGTWMQRAHWLSSTLQYQIKEKERNKQK